MSRALLLSDCATTDCDSQVCIIAGVLAQDYGTVMRGNILRSYRELLTLLQRLPRDAQLSATKEVKAKIRAHREETDSLAITDLHKQLVAKLSFLRMTTSFRPGERRQSISGTFVLREGELVESDREREHRWCIGISYSSKL